MLTKKELC